MTVTVPKHLRIFTTKRWRTFLAFTGDPEGWTEWSGGYAMPPGLSDNENVAVKLRDASETSSADLIPWVVPS